MLVCLFVCFLFCFLVWVLSCGVLCLCFGNLSDYMLFCLMRVGYFSACTPLVQPCFPMFAFCPVFLLVVCFLCIIVAVCIVIVCAYFFVTVKFVML